MLLRDRYNGLVQNPGQTGQKHNASIVAQAAEA